MAKSVKNEPTRTTIDNINDQLIDVEQRVENNKKSIVWAIIGLLVIILAVLLFVYSYMLPKQLEAKEAIAKADKEQIITGNDSVALALYSQVADKYSDETGNRATLQAAELLYSQGKFEEALKRLNDYSVKDNIVGAAAYALKGDCYVNLDNLDEALKCFDKAINASDDNAIYTPLFMLKKANVLNAKKDYKGALAIYESIENNYSEFSEFYNFDVTKYIARAKAQLGEE